MGNTLRSYSQRSLFLVLILRTNSNNRFRSRRENEPIPAEIRLTQVSRRRMIISDNNDIVRALKWFARDINKIIFILSGHGFIRAALLFRPPLPQPHLMIGPRRINGIDGTVLPRQILVPNHVVDTDEGIVPLPNMTIVTVSLLRFDGGEYNAATRLSTYGDVELDVIFYTGDGPMFQPNYALDEPELPPNTIRFL